ncbi:unnamed protein product [Callosobruchus maculatus]|uniref:IGFBP N-terminal domain-containing protein n=1 Tax=Callosobruchus maculatus TaxID=64391 RepID=A0A653CGN1_CALMS|nr:unnamed protein product [Callosobruchus maculatus]
MASRIAVAFLAVVAVNQMMASACCILSPLGGTYGGCGVGTCGGALPVPIPAPVKLPLVIKPLLDLDCDGPPSCSATACGDAPCGTAVHCHAPPPPPCNSCANTVLLKKLLPLLLASSPAHPTCGGCGSCSSCRY